MIAKSLRAFVGNENEFMDSSSIEPGTTLPRRIRDALANARDHDVKLLIAQTTSRGADVLNRRRLIIGEFATLLADRHYATLVNAIVPLALRQRDDN